MKKRYTMNLSVLRARDKTMLVGRSLEMDVEDDKEALEEVIRALKDALDHAKDQLNSLRRPIKHY